MKFSVGKPGFDFSQNLDFVFVFYIVKNTKTKQIFLKSKSTCFFLALQKVVDFTCFQCQCFSQSEKQDFKKKNKKSKTESNLKNHEKKSQLSLESPHLSYVNSHNLSDTIINKKIFLLFMILFFYKKIEFYSKFFMLSCQNVFWQENIWLLYIL